MFNMQTGNKKQKTAGFTLVELLIALAVISLFGCFVLPNAKKVITMAHIEVDKQRLSALFGQYMYAANSGQLNLTDVKTMIDFSVALAQAGGPNEVSAYQSGTRKHRERKQILIKGKKNSSLNEKDFDFIFVNPRYENGDRTPLFYTRGLQPDGTWCGDGLYGSDGGIVVFEGGMMECLSSVDDDVLDCILGQKKPLSNTFKSVPNEDYRDYCLNREAEDILFQINGNSYL